MDKTPQYASLFVIDYLIKVEQGLQIRAVICWDQCLQTTLNVTVGRLGVCCGAEAQEPKADVEVVMRTVLGLLEVQNGDGVRPGDIPRAGLLRSAQRPAELVEGPLNDVAHAHGL
ncbi:hypothetical protein NFJ07_17835 [Arthrobacter sp. B2a2-09]|nr:hypothetical protein [Arthrobacter sp. B2a2-09]MCZ9883645.1 hypothetical protein [Arthrobacter sp. B2a2-09]